VQPDITAHQPLTKCPRGRLKAAGVGLIATGLITGLTSGWCLIDFLKLRSEPTNARWRSRLLENALAVLGSFLYRYRRRAKLLGSAVARSTQPLCR